MKKKLLLFFLFSLIAITGINAQQFELRSAPLNKSANLTMDETPGTSMLFGYSSTNLYSSLGSGSGVVVGGGALLTSDILSKYAGNQIAALQIGIGSGTTTNAQIFLAYDKTSTPFYTQNVTFTAESWNTINLTTPYTIESGKDVFIGYKVTSGSTTPYPIGVDEGPAQANGDLLFYKGSWINISASGYDCNIAILALLEGNTLPQRDLKLSSLDVNSVVRTNGSFTITSTVKNNAAQTVSSYDIVYQIDNNSPVTVPVSGVSITNLETNTFSIDNASIDTDGSHTLSVTIANINGGTDENSADNTLTTTFSSANTLYPRKIVAEEGTGTWCGWCPRGAVAMAYMKEKYPDSFIGIAVHVGSSSKADPMQVSTYAQGINGLVSGYPSALINRKLVIDPGDLEPYFLVQPDSSLFSLKLYGTFADEAKSKINLTATTESGLDISSANYKLGFVITENHVTGTTSGYSQSNYYAGGGYGTMGGYENLASTVPATQMVYEDVARIISATFTGTARSVPTTITKNVPFTYNYVLPVPSNVNNLDEIDVITLLFDATTGEIVNAERIKASDIGSGISQVNVGNENFSVYASGSSIKIDGTYSSAIVYDLIGNIVAKTDNNQGSIATGRGIYLVKVVDGSYSSVKKILVK